MVYNALKLFMEINPELFDETMHQYKQRKLESVSNLGSTMSQLMTKFYTVNKSMQ